MPRRQLIWVVGPGPARMAIPLEWAPSDTIDNAMEEASLNFGRPVRRLLLAGQPLESGQTLADYGIGPDAEIECRMTIRGGGARVLRRPAMLPRQLIWVVGPRPGCMGFPCSGRRSTRSTKLWRRPA